MLLKFLGKTFRRKRPQSELREAALAAHARGELGLAERHFRELALQNPSDLSSWTNLAATLVKQSKFQEAIPSCSKSSSCSRISRKRISISASAAAG